jgi:hypothetical protein
MQQRIHGALPGPIVPILGPVLVTGLLLAVALLPLGVAACLSAAVLGLGVARRVLPFLTQRAKYERRHMRLAGPRPGANLG